MRATILAYLRPLSLLKKIPSNLFSIVCVLLALPFLFNLRDTVSAQFDPVTQLPILQPPLEVSAAEWKALRQQITSEYTEEIIPEVVEELQNYHLTFAIDGDTLVIGVPAEDSGATGINPDPNSSTKLDSGAVFIYERDGAGAWQKTTYIKAPTSDEYDYFGSRIAIDGDTLVVAAQGESSAAAGSNGDQSDNSLTDAGAVYIYQRTAGVWQLQTYLKPDAPQAGAIFGNALGLKDGVLVVGSSLFDLQTNPEPSATPVNYPDSGAVYVFRYASGSWNQEARLHSPYLGDIKQFGFSLTLDTDTIAIGIPTESRIHAAYPDSVGNRWSASGAVSIYSYQDNAWSLQSYLKPETLIRGGAFGHALALEGDLLLVGSPGHSEISTSRMGEVYAFKRVGATWQQQQRISSPDRETDGYFGRSLSLKNGVAIIASWGDRSGESGLHGNPYGSMFGAAGALFVYRHVGDTWGYESYVKALTPSSFDRFSQYIAFDGDQFVTASRPNSIDRAIIYHMKDHLFVSNTKKFLTSNTTASTTELTDLGLVPRDTAPVTRTIQLSNMGLSPVPIDSITLTGSSAFTIKNASHAEPLTPGRTRDIVVSFDPQQNGPHSASLVISSQGNSPSFTVNFQAQVENALLHVQGLGQTITNNAAPSLANGSDLGLVGPGVATTTRYFTLKNDGLAPLTITGVTMTGMDEFLLRSYLVNSTIGPGASRQLQIDFKPNSHGIKISTITLTTNISPSTFILNLKASVDGPIMRVTADNTTIPTHNDSWLSPANNFGPNTATAWPRSRSFEIWNDGTSDLNIESITLVGDPAFSITSAPISSPIPSGTSGSFTIQLDPHLQGSYKTSVVIRSNASSIPYVVNIAVGVNVGNFSVLGNNQLINNRDLPSPHNHTDFGQTKLGSAPIVRTFTIANNGQENLIVGSVTLYRLNSSNFRIETYPSAIVGPGGRTNLQVAFDPNTLGNNNVIVMLNLGSTIQTQHYFTVHASVVEADAVGGGTIGEPKEPIEPDKPDEPIQTTYQTYLPIVRR